LCSHKAAACNKPNKNFTDDCYGKLHLADILEKKRETATAITTTTTKQYVCKSRDP